MTDLTKQKCEACTKKSPPINLEKIAKFKSQIPDWHIILINLFSLLPVACSQILQEV